MSLRAASVCRSPLRQAFRHNHGASLRPQTRVLRSRSHIVRAYGNKDKEQFLKGVSPANRDDVAKILDQAQRAESTWTSVFTDFYTPPIITDAIQVLKPLSDIRAEPWGGYDMAERTRLRLSRADMPEDEAGLAAGVSAVLVKGNFIFDSANHRDFLGACLGTGIERSKVRTVTVKTQQVELDELTVREVKVQEIRSVEASLRVDAIASAGFRTSRGKIADMIKAGDVRVNWKEAKASTQVKPGDIISCHGKGRCEVKSVDMTKKERFAVQMVRYI